MYDIYGTSLLAKATERNLIDPSKFRKEDMQKIYDDASS